MAEIPRYLIWIIIIIIAIIISFAILFAIAGVSGKSFFEEIFEGGFGMF